MAFLIPESLEQEFEHKEDEINKLREERRKHILDSNSYFQLCFSLDSIKIPYCDDSDYTYLIDGTKCYDVENSNEIKNRNDFIMDYEYMDYEHIYFKRARTENENQFMRDYRQLTNYKTTASIKKFKPNTKNEFTIEIFEKLKESLLNEISLSNLRTIN